MRTGRLPLVLAVGLLLSAGSAHAADKAKRRLDHEVGQAILYIGMKLPEQARDNLTKIVEQEPGKSDALAWLGLARAHYELKALDEAGRAFQRAEGLGVDARLDEKAWAKKFHAEFKESIGSLRLNGAECENVKFSVKLAAPMVNRGRRALLEALPGWRKKTFTRPTTSAFFMPVGQYKFGELKVKVIPGEETGVTAGEIGAECTALPGVAVVGPGPNGLVATSSVAAGGSKPEPNFFSDNWWLLALGAVAVAGGAAAAVVATRERDVGITLFGPP